jgi:hypothetical protein
MKFPNELFRIGYIDASKGDDFIKSDMPSAYYEGVRLWDIEQDFIDPYRY